MIQPLRLLAVDDDIDSAELIVRVAERCGYEGFATSDSRGVMNLTNALKPDLVSVDICMPNIDANELFVILADSGFTGNIMIVSGQQISVLEETRNYAESLGLTVKHMQQKPLDFKALRTMFTKHEDASKNAA
ncbi:MAG: response regulator [Pseudomonadota bacterium]